MVYDPVLALKEEMKGGNSSRARGSHISVILIAIIFATIVLCVLEKNPIATLQSITREQYMIPSVFLVHDPPQGKPEGD